MKIRYSRQILVFIASIGIVSAIAVAKSPTFANNEQAVKLSQLQTLQNSEVEANIKEQTLAWIDGWSPGEESFDPRRLQPLYAQGDNAVLVYDDIGDEVAVIRSWDEYAQTWQPFMQQFAYWSIQPEGEIEITAGEDMAVSNFTYVGEARYQDGREITPKQYATLVWQNQEGNWVIVHEHLTTAN